jgi:hypothetical protein
MIILREAYYDMKEAYSFTEDDVLGSYVSIHLNTYAHGSTHIHALAYNETSRGGDTRASNSLHYKL